jgi:rhamnulokinase
MLKFLSYDLGASSGRAMIATYNGKKMNIRELFRFPTSPVRVQAGYYWDVLSIFNHMKHALVKCKSEAGTIRSLGIDAFGVDFGLLSRTGELLANPLCDCDTRTKGSLRPALEIYSMDEMYKITGAQIYEMTTLFQLYALKLQGNPILEVADTLLMMPDLLNYFFTGIKATELTVASTTNLLSPFSKNWLSDVIASFGLPSRIFTDIIPPGHVLGNLSGFVRDELSCGDIKVVTTAEHDTAAAAASVPAKEKEYVFISSGTWSIVGTETSEAVINMKFSGVLSNERCFNGGNRLIKNLLGMKFIQECRQEWESEGTGVEYTTMNEMSEKCVPFVSFIDPEDTNFFVEQNMLMLIADYCRLTDQPIPQTIGEVVICINQSLAMAYRRTILQMEEALGKKLANVYIVGGGTQNTLLCKMTADATGKPVIAGYRESASLGNALVQAMTFGEIRNADELRECARISYPIQVYEPQNTGMWDSAYEKFTDVLAKKARLTH